MTEKETALKVVNTILLLKKRFFPGELQKLLDKINREETVQPMIDPTYFIKNADNLKLLKKQTEALQKVIEI